jgi:LPXTG-motif cell wall-anchored protein
VLSGVDASITSPSGARVNLRQVSLVLSLGIARSNTGGNVAITTQSAGDPVATVAPPPPLLDSTVTSRQALAANTGEAALGVAAALGAVDRQSTGHAVAGNDGVIVICQRVDWADAGDCLAPPQEEPPPPPPPSETTTTTLARSDQGLTPPSPTPAPADPTSTSTTVVVTPKESGAPPHGFAPPARGDLPSTGSDLGPFLAIGIVGVLVGFVMLLFGRRPRRDRNASITTSD